MLDPLCDFAQDAFGFGIASRMSAVTGTVQLTCGRTSSAAWNSVGTMRWTAALPSAAPAPRQASRRQRHVQNSYIIAANIIYKF